MKKEVIEEFSKDNEAKELYNAINNYESDIWKDSVEFKKLMKILKSTSIKQLKTQGYDIPNWKYNKER